MPRITEHRALPWALASLTLLPLSAGAAPPLGTRPEASSASPLAADGGGRTDSTHPTYPTPPTDGGTTSRTTAGQPTSGEALTECPPSEPIRVGPDLCMSQEAIDRVNDGWQATVDPITGEVTWTPPPFYDPATGRWGNFNAGTQACDPTIEVQLKQAALAGSQLTRAISDRQMSYPEVDPLAAVNNPRKDGYGGVCTIDFFALDLGRLLGTTYDQIKNLIDTLSRLSVDGLFGAACNVVNRIFGNLQNQLLQELQSSTPLTAFQQFVNALRIGYIVPLQSLTGYGLTVHPTTATLPGVTTAHPLQVSYVPGRGYVYLADFGSGNLLVLHIAPTPLAPADAVAPTAP